MSLLDGDPLPHRRKVDIWWVQAVERIGVGTLVALVVLYLGWKTLDQLAAVVRANTEAVNNLNVTLAKQSEKIDNLASRMNFLERSHTHEQGGQ